MQLEGFVNIHLNNGHKKHNKQWRTKLHILKLLEKKYNVTHYKTKQDIRQLTYIYTEHNTRRALAHKTVIVDEPTCQLCNLEAEITEHYLAKCRAIATTRYQLIREAFSTLNKIVHSKTPKTMLKFINTNKQASISNPQST